MIQTLCLGALKMRRCTDPTWFHVRATWPPWPKAVLIFYWPSDWAMELQAVVDDMVLQKHPQPLPWIQLWDSMGRCLENDEARKLLEQARTRYNWFQRCCRFWCCQLWHSHGRVRMAPSRWWATSWRVADHWVSERLGRVSNVRSCGLQIPTSCGRHGSGGRPWVEEVGDDWMVFCW